jgi:phosphinothricin acetyltransferase
VPIRLVRLHDAAAVHQIYAPVVETTAISFELEVPSIDEMRRRIERTMPEYPWIVAEVDGRIVGYAFAARGRTDGGSRRASDAARVLNQPSVS